MVFDFHTHTFPDKIAAAALDKLKSASHTRPFTNGTVDGLKGSMLQSGIDASLVLPVATNTRQVAHVNDSSIAINSLAAETGIYSFGCMHPDFEDYDSELTRLKASGVKGIKLHPVYQGVDFNDARYLRILEKCQALGLIVLIHSGLDVGFPGVVHASPDMVKDAVSRVGPLTLVLAHMGGWRCWQEAADKLSGLGLYIDTSFSIGRMTPLGDGHYSESELDMLTYAEATRIIRAFGSDHTLFGTDSPWGGQAESLSVFGRLELTPDEKRLILWQNAARLLEIQ